MPKISDERDTPAEVLRRSAQDDPWVMYLVVRSDVAVSAEQVLLAGAAATMRCADELGDSDAWRESFRAWAERSFRKVTLRAKGSAWEKLASYDAGRADVGGVELVRALPPRLRSTCGPLIRNLQVYNPDVSQLAPPASAPSERDPSAMVFAINPRAAMSVGKQLAQVAHAVLMCAWSRFEDDPRYREGFAAWRARGYPGWFAPAGEWDALRAREDNVVVRDAGLTEVDPGTETVLALPPGVVLA